MAQIKTRRPPVLLVALKNGKVVIAAQRVEMAPIEHGVWRLLVQADGRVTYYKLSEVVSVTMRSPEIEAAD